jgi:hypothetical protein
MEKDGKKTIPRCTFNHRDELVSFDTDMAHRMAADFRMKLALRTLRK